MRGSEPSRRIYVGITKAFIVLCLFLTSSNNGKCANWKKIAAHRKVSRMWAAIRTCSPSWWAMDGQWRSSQNWLAGICCECSVRWVLCESFFASLTRAESNWSAVFAPICVSRFCSVPFQWLLRNCKPTLELISFRFYCSYPHGNFTLSLPLSAGRTCPRYEANEQWQAIRGHSQLPTATSNVGWAAV